MSVLAGTSPHLLVSLWPACAHHIISMIAPTKGMSANSCSHPLLPISCRRRAPTAKEGTKTTSE